MADKPLNGNHVTVAPTPTKPVSLRVLTRELKSLRDRQQDPWAYRVIGDALRVLEGPKPVIAPAPAPMTECPHGVPHRYPCEACADEEHT